MTVAPGLCGTDLYTWRTTALEIQYSIILIRVLGRCNIFQYIYGILVNSARLSETAYSSQKYHHQDGPAECVHRFSRGRISTGSILYNIRTRNLQPARAGCKKSGISRGISRGRKFLPRDLPREMMARTTLTSDRF